MKQRRKNILLGAGLVLVMLLSIVAYSRYTQRQITTRARKICFPPMGR